MNACRRRPLYNPRACPDSPPASTTCSPFRRLLSPRPAGRSRGGADRVACAGAGAQRLPWPDAMAEEHRALGLARRAGPRGRRWRPRSWSVRGFGNRPERMGLQMSDTILIEEGLRPRTLGLIKFIMREHVSSFRSGRIRMGSVRSYREQYEQDAGGRNDPREHLGTILQPDRIRMDINGILIEGLAAPVEIRPDTDDISYLLCLTAITDHSLNAAGGILKSDPELLHLGDAAVIVQNVDQFQKRLKAGICATGFLRSHVGQNRRASGLVEYVDFSAYHGDLGPFKKSKDFAFQQEWRLALAASREEPRADHLFLEIGDLSDVTAVMDSADVLRSEFRTLPKPGAKPIR